MFTFNADLEESLYKSNKVLNVSTGRYIMINGALYKKMIASGCKHIAYVITNDESIIAEIEAYYDEQDKILFQQQLAEIATEEVAEEIAEGLMSNFGRSCPRTA